mgnify:FL=1
MSDLRRGIFYETKTNVPVSIYRRNLQKLFVSKLIETMSTEKTNITFFSGRRVVLADTDIPSIARGQLLELKNQLKTAALSNPDRLTKFHLNDLVSRIENAMKPK